MTRRGSAAALRRSIALGLLLVSAAGVAACNDQEPPATTARFNRPNRVAFACAQNGMPLPLADCAVSAPGRSEFALVTQRARGELATVDFSTFLILDSRRDIPGYTFVPVGETPVAIQVPKLDPEFTYVANFGSRDIRVLDTAALVAPLSSDATLDVFRLQTDSGVAAPTDMLLTPSEDALIVAAADAGVLFWLPLPLTRCSGEDPSCPAGDIAGKRVIPLQGSAELGAANPPPDFEPSQYEQLCGFERQQALTLAPVPELPESVATTKPRPISLGLDLGCPTDVACTPRVLVADEALPLIHAIDLALIGDPNVEPADAVLDPLLTGVPTRAVVATPVVPATLEGGQTKYIYAIDAIDGSVLAMENGRVLEVSAGTARRPDRLEFTYRSDVPAPSAAALEVVTPGYDPAEDPWRRTCEGNPTRNPAMISGVFLAVALTDGTLRMADVHDMEIGEVGVDVDFDGNGPALPAPGPCRQCSGAPFPILVRHQQRVAVNVTVPDDENVPVLAPAGQLAFSVDGVTFPVRADGTSATPFAPSLACIACGAEFVQAAPLQLAGGESDGSDEDAGVAEEIDPATGCGPSASALLCAPPDPWSGADDRWRASFEGTLPNTIGGRGAFVDPSQSETGGVEFTLEVDPCQAGVLGNEDMPSAYATDCRLAATDAPAAEAARGDQLVIATRPLSNERLTNLDDDGRARCRALADALAAEGAPPLAFEIRRAYSDRLVIRQNLVDPIELPATVRGGNTVESFEDVTACMPDTPIAYSIRTLGAFTVVGAKSGFQHRVHANAAKRCVIDPEANPLQQGRAALDCTFRNQELAFQLTLPPRTESLRPGVTLNVEALAPLTKLTVGTESTGTGTVVPVQLYYNALDGLLYLMDINARGLLPIELNPVPPVASRSFN